MTAVKKENSEGIIILLFGASGSGKSLILSELMKEDGCSIHAKQTDRAPRQYDGPEIVSVDQVEADYIYGQYGKKYGIDKKQIEKSLALKEKHFIICNDIETIKVIKKDYKDQVIVIYLHMEAPEETLLKIQKERDISDDEIALRIRKIERFSELYVDNRDLFDGKILNVFNRGGKALFELTFKEIEERLLLRSLKSAPVTEKELTPISKVAKRSHTLPDTANPFILFLQSASIKHENKKKYLKKFKKALTRVGFRTESSSHHKAPDFRSNLDLCLGVVIDLSDIDDFLMAKSGFAACHCYYNKKPLIIISRKNKKMPRVMKLLNGKNVQTIKQAINELNRLLQKGGLK